MLFSSPVCKILKRSLLSLFFGENPRFRLLEHHQRTTRLPGAFRGLKEHIKSKLRQSKVSYVAILLLGITPVDFLVPPSLPYFKEDLQCSCTLTLMV